MILQLLKNLFKAPIDLQHWTLWVRILAGQYKAITKRNRSNNTTVWLFDLKLESVDVRTQSACFKGAGVSITSSQTYLCEVVVNVHQYQVQWTKINYQLINSTPTVLNTVEYSSEHLPEVFPVTFKLKSNVSYGKIVKVS